MLKRTMVIGLLGAALFVALCATGVALAGAPGGGGAGGFGGAPGGGGGGGGGGRGGFDPAQMRARQVERIMEQLAVGEQDRAAIEPLVSKVVELSAQVRPGMGGMRGGRGGQPGAAAPEDTTRQLAPVEKATQALRTTLENESASPEAIKAALKVLRDAREQAKQDLAKAQDQLREVLNVRQEAQLVLMGLLE